MTLKLEERIRKVQEISDWTDVDKEQEITRLVEEYLPASELLRKMVDGETTCEKTAYDLVGRYSGWWTFLLPSWRGRNYSTRMKESGLGEVLDLKSMAPVQHFEGTGTKIFSFTKRYIMDPLFSIPGAATASGLFVKYSSEHGGNTSGGLGLLVVCVSVLLGAMILCPNELDIKRIMGGAKNLDKAVEIYNQNTS